MLNVVLGVAVGAGCLVLQALLAIVALRYYVAQGEGVQWPSMWSALPAMLVVLLLLSLGTMLQISLWAWLFLSLGEFSSFIDAAYHSAVNFATLGYGDIVMSEAHRLLGPLEAINGVMMIGVSTAVFMAVFQDVLKRLSTTSNG